MVDTKAALVTSGMAEQNHWQLRPLATESNKPFFLVAARKDELNPNDGPAAALMNHAGERLGAEGEMLSSKDRKAPEIYDKFKTVVHRILSTAPADGDHVQVNGDSTLVLRSDDVNAALIYENGTDVQPGSEYCMLVMPDASDDTIHVISVYKTKDRNGSVSPTPTIHAYSKITSLGERPLDKDKLNERLDVCINQMVKIDDSRKRPQPKFSRAEVEYE